MGRRSYRHKWEGLKFTAIDNNVQIGMKGFRSVGTNVGNQTIQYSINNGRSWQTFVADGNTSYFCTLQAGKSVLVKGNNETYTYTSGGFRWFSFISAGGKWNASGNINSLIGFSKAVLPDWCYYRLFENCTDMVTAPDLPSESIGYHSYGSMFYGCTSLVSCPDIAATTLATESCDWMFGNCTSLTTAKVPAATTLAYSCYYAMFSGCTSLTAAPQLPATTLAEQCYIKMFQGCTSLVTAPSLPVTALAVQCYEEMFVGCSSLSTVPSLPADTLVTRCYAGMFKNCTSLTSVNSLPATTLATQCYIEMFSGCTSLNHAVWLRVQTLVTECYKKMFYNCSSLSNMNCFATNNSDGAYTEDWLYGVAISGQFTKVTGSSWPSGASGIPSGWSTYSGNLP